MSSEQKNLNKQDYILNKNIWITPYITNEGFSIDMALFHVMAPFEDQIVRNSIETYKMGSQDLLTPEPFVGEWDTTYMRRGAIDGRGIMTIENKYASLPDTREEALRRIFEFFDDNYKLNTFEHPWTSLLGIYPWHHYGGEMGFDRIGVELGEGISSYQGKIAFTRGAGRQYGKTWFVDFSAWHQGYMLDYSIDKKIWQEGGVDHGHSMSLMNRTFMMSYMSGMNFFIFEAGSLLAFYPTTNEKGLYNLTPYGEVVQKCNAFALNNPDVGTAYTPFGVVLDYYHGSSGGDDGIVNDAKKAFYSLDYEEGDNMSYEVLNTLFPKSFQVIGFEETTQMVNCPYGDTCDVLLQNASQEVLNSYPSLILSGDIKLSADEVNRYKAYVDQGGTLVLNTAYLSYFPEYKASYKGSDKQEIAVKKGKVIFYGPNFDISQLKGILAELTAKYIPFKMSKNVEYIMNVKDGSLLLTLINNDGVKKNPAKPVEIDASKKIDLEVTYTGGEKILSAKELVGGSVVSVVNSKVSVLLESGEVKVIEFKFD